MKWEYSRIPIGNLVEQVKKWNPQTDKDNQVITYLDIASVNRESKKVEESIEIQSHEAPSRARQLVRKDDVLVSTVRPNLNAVAYLEEEFDGATASTGFCVLRAKSDKLDSRYLYYWVRTTYFIDDMVRESTGASYPAVSDSIIKKNEIPLPPLEEQKRIAAILDKADRIRRKRQEAIRLTEELGRSIFLDMFGDPVTNPKGWEMVTIGDIVTDVRDGPHVSPKYSDKGIPILSTRNIRPGQLLIDDIKHISNETYLNLVRKFKPQLGDVLLTKGGTTGFAKVVDWKWPFAIWVHLACLRPTSRVLPEFLEAALNSPNCYSQSQKYTHGIANRDLGLKRIIKIKLSLPPIDLQEKYCILNKRIADQKIKNATLLEESENLFNSLLQRAFRREL